MQDDRTIYDAEETTAVSDLFPYGSDAPATHEAPSTESIPTGPWAPTERTRSAGRAARRAERERRRRRRRRTITTLVAVLLVLGGGGYAVYAVVLPALGLLGGSSSVSDYPGPGHDSVQVVVASGDTGSVIGRKLADAGVVATATAFTQAFAANPAAAGIQPGTYTLQLEMKAVDAVSALLNSANRVETRVTIPEGLRASQVYEKIASVTGIPLDQVQAAAADTAAIGLPAEAGGAVEGWLFPATYAFEPEMTATQMLSQMVAKTVSVLDARAVPADQRETVLTKASIVEKEVNSSDDYGKVARVIENRLERTIALQMDSINAYGLNKSGVDLTAADLQADNPYNSRLHVGLPPTPIANPGEGTIDAALNPTPGDWTYFVTVNLDTGETVFTDDYEEFLAAKEQYQQWVKENG